MRSEEEAKEFLEKLKSMLRALMETRLKVGNYIVETQSGRLGACTVRYLGNPTVVCSVVDGFTVDEELSSMLEEARDFTTPVDSIVFYFFGAGETGMVAAERVNDRDYDFIVSVSSLEDILDALFLVDYLMSVGREA